jgi:hypothetical protein
MDVSGAVHALCMRFKALINLDKFDFPAKVSANRLGEHSLPACVFRKARNPLKKLSKLGFSFLRSTQPYKERRGHGVK